MDRIRAALLGDPDDLGDRQIGLNRSHAFADPIGFIGLEPMQTEFVLFGKDGDGLFAHFVRGTHHADGDFATVGHQDLAEIGHVRPHPLVV